MASLPTTKTFTYPIIEWFHVHGRHHLPWQNPRTPYRVWISEIMLQQTQVATVIPYFERFMANYPRLSNLATSDLDSLLALWSGLGYYRRAHNIHKAAGLIQNEHHGVFPKDEASILALPGIGPSTRGAILSLGFDQPSVILDGNVKRVLTRILDFPHPPSETKHHKALWDIAKTLLPSSHAAAYSQALMDLGATLCTKSDPSCQKCPIQTICGAYKKGNQHLRPVRTKSTKKRRIETFVLLIQDASGHLLVEKQKPHGRFPSLWHAPLSEAPLSWCKTQGLLIAKNTQSISPIDHHLSHIHYHFKPILMQLKQKSPSLPQNFSWQAIPSFATLGLPAWMHQCLKKIEEEM